MRRGFTILILLLLLASPLILAQKESEAPAGDNVLKDIDIKQFAKDNPWNETITISPVWQTLIGGFFGLNLHNESTEINVREAIMFFMVFVMFFILIADILKITPFFKNKILDEIPAEYVASLILTMIVSITGAFINLKNLFISGIAYTVTALDWTWLNNAIANRGFWAFFVGVLIVLGIFIIHEALSWIDPIIKKYSQVSRAEAEGRMMRNTIKGDNN